MKAKVLFLIGLVFLWVKASFGIQGVCSNCHTMHNSQGGVQVVASVSEYLLVKDCFGCHAQGGSQAIVNWNGNLLPQVYHSDPTDLAGGNFGYIDGLKGGAASDQKGHNVVALVGTDANNNMQTPGGINQFGHDDGSILNGELNCAGENGCHGRREPLSGVKGLKAISGSHHRNTSGWCDGTTSGSSYRFLLGVKGYEDPDWQYTASSTDHNEYFGRTSPVKLGCGSGELSCHASDSYIKPPDGTMSQFCATCHGNFHTLTTSRSEGVGTASPWLRHPTDYAIPNDYEYANYNQGTLSYSLLAPVARTSSPITAVSSSVTPGSDAVMCLSCHYAHASNYPDMLRWDYNSCVASSGANDPNCGCFVCHTTK